MVLLRKCGSKSLLLLIFLSLLLGFFPKFYVSQDIIVTFGGWVSRFGGKKRRLAFDP